MNFYIKVDKNSRRKAKMVAGNNTTKTPSLVSYSSVVSLDLLIIVIMVAALNGLDLQAAGIEMLI